MPARHCWTMCSRQPSWWSPTRSRCASPAQRAPARFPRPRGRSAARAAVAARPHSRPAEPGIVLLMAKDDLFADWLTETGAVAAVIRPDRYVYGVARAPADLTQLVDELAGALFDSVPAQQP